MNFNIEDTNLDEVKIIHYKRFYDNRGFFAETFRFNIFEDFGLPKFVQENMSVSSKGVLRGMHWQETPFSQGKLVQCIYGSILDVAVDIRVDSATRGQHVSVLLDQNDSKYLWIPEGFAHGFQALVEDTVVSYKVTEYWNSNFEKCVNPLSSKLQIQWPLQNPKISTKDSNAPQFI